MIRLNVGCGRNILDGWVNLDKDGPLPFDLEKCGTEVIPLRDNFVDEFLLSHVIEHIRNPLSVMQELYRIAKPNAEMTIRVPFGASDDAYEDPTHVRPYFLNSFAYFAQPTYWRADYGYRADWQAEIIHLSILERFQGPRPQVMERVMTLRNVVTEMVVKLIAIKPARAQNKDLRKNPQVLTNYV